MNQADDDGQTPLRLASQKGHLEVARVLLAHEDVAVNQADVDGLTPLSEAGSPEIASIL